MKLSQDSQLKMQALFDLSMRARAGIYIYCAIWLVFVIAFDFVAMSIPLVVINSIILLVMMAIRIAHMSYIKNANEDNVQLLYHLLIFSVLLSALHWGVLTAWVLTFESANNASHLMLIVLPAFAMGGASALAISNVLRIFYPLALYVPPLFMFYYSQDPLNTVYAVSILISYIYIISASKYPRENYWSAIKNHLIAEERATELEQLSTTDKLTQLKNRMYFDEEFDNEWRRSYRLNAPISVIMIDLDHFKKLNDTYGHLFGDEVLRRTAAVISNELKRPTDCIARYGGEEFIALLPNTDAEGAKVTGERIRHAVESMQIEHDDKVVRITCCVGASSTVPVSTLNHTDIIKRADSALYEAKRSGRNRYVAVNPEE
ncbi:GGDEF domain-containing protein [Alteromonas sp. ASW11-36]|uniref:diguanylate cyclase n=1 Tax=Alteromonas arenosi TaxID=3055817 RepID=A0ABT7SXU4_9ALTE|nr:GGDEF domain-containing protein [Alteromonas sp. ASW11-36]MDM7860824.1 GGDEF domain-containing protein [Alteromonas sp. ASW11-36]